MKQQFYFRPIRTQSVAYTGTAGVITNGIGTQIRYVRVYATSACHIAIGAAPTATTSDIPLAAATAEIFQVTPGEKISAIQQSSGGSLFVTELSGG